MVDTAISPADYDFVTRLLLEHCALALPPGKEYLLKSRLVPLAQRHGFASLGRLFDELRRPAAGPLMVEIVEAMVTNETSFFRDVHPFETLRATVLPELIEARRRERELRIWCAAGSSGQEPYSLALLLREHFAELSTWRVELLASDISGEMIERARAGRYSQIEVSRGLPTPLLLKWFRQEAGAWHLADEVRSMVTFQQINLARPWPPMPRWDLILLRNVMIYFEAPVKTGILERAARTLRADGYLILGGAETTLNLHDGFARAENLKSGFYRLKPVAAPLASLSAESMP
jgi:chemotaxis protein methyltransferase CheR